MAPIVSITLPDLPAVLVQHDPINCQVKQEPQYDIKNVQTIPMRERTMDCSAQYPVPVKCKSIEDSDALHRDNMQPISYTHDSITNPGVCKSHYSSHSSHYYL